MKTINSSDRRSRSLADRRSPAKHCPIFSKALLLLLWLVATTASHAEWITLSSGNQYRLTNRTLGFGGESTVILAIDEQTGNEVALKIYKPGNGPAPADLIAQAKATSGAQHILFPTDQGQVMRTGTDSIVLGTEIEILPLKSMSLDVMAENHLWAIGEKGGRARTLNPAEIFERAEHLERTTWQLLKIWEGFANKDLLHNDIKPENLLVNGTNDIFLNDLSGLRKSPMTFNESRDLGVTPLYSSEELWAYRYNTLSSHKVVDTLSDLYGISATLRSLMCNGCTPQELVKSLIELKEKIPDSPERQKAFACLAFVADVIDAGNHYHPRDRLAALQRGRLGEIVKIDIEERRRFGRVEYKLVRPKLQIAEPPSFSHYMKDGLGTDLLTRLVRNRTPLTTRFYNFCARVFGTTAPSQQSAAEAEANRRATPNYIWNE